MSSSFENVDYNFPVFPQLPLNALNFAFDVAFETFDDVPGRKRELAIGMGELQVQFKSPGVIEKLHHKLNQSVVGANITKAIEYFVLPASNGQVHLYAMYDNGACSLTSYAATAASAYPMGCFGDIAPTWNHMGQNGSKSLWSFVCSSIGFPYGIRTLTGQWQVNAEQGFPAVSGGGITVVTTGGPGGHHGDSRSATNVLVVAVTSASPTIPHSTWTIPPSCQGVKKWSGDKMGPNFGRLFFLF